MTRSAVAHVGDAALAYTVRGDGAFPVLLNHGSGLADFMKLVAEHPALDGYTVINYHRVGYGNSSRPLWPMLVGDYAEQAIGLLDHLGIGDSVDVVGHSFGGLIAATIAYRQPFRVRSLALLEPLHMQVPAMADIAQHVLGPALAAWGAGDVTRAVDLFLSGVAHPRWQAIASQALPGSVIQSARASAPALFQTEMPAARDWNWDALSADRLPSSLLLMLGSASSLVSEVYSQGHADLKRRYPHAQEHIVPGATHMLPLEDPSDVAQALAAHFRNS
jgi:pimeloyl-ACP methyl ester carboxylesterase